MSREKILNKYYNMGKFNHPSRIGYVMKMIRELKPYTVDEWMIWYFDNIHNEEYVKQLATEMYESIPFDCLISKKECLNYVYDVMFRRTFQGYNKEKLALKLLRDKISPNIQEAPADWDTEYFIDFFCYSNDKKPIGIQLKPESFYYGNYQYIVDINCKIKSFCEKFQTEAYILKYLPDNSNNQIIITNMEVLEKIKIAINA